MLAASRRVFPISSGPSNTQVDKAGERIRGWLASDASEEALDTPEMVAAFETLVIFRQSFFAPLGHVSLEVSRVLERLAPGQRVVGRHKKYSRIFYKLMRRSTMRLTQMEDIGGCRVVLQDRAQSRELFDRVLERWPDAHVDDYVSHPKTSGYRAVHVVVVENSRRIEIQIRTERQNEWADAVERTGDRLDLPLKDEEGPAELLEYFRRAADRIATEEEGGTVDEDFEAAFDALRERVRPYFERE